MTRSSTTTGAAGRPRARGAAVVALLAALCAALFAAPAMALPPGGPNEQRGGASVTITNRVVQPAGSTTPLPTGVTQEPGKVQFTGTGFTDGELVLVKIDDGAVAPDTTTRPAAPAGSSPNSDDWFVAVEASATGTINGEVDLADVLASDAAELASGKHHLRFVSLYPRATLAKGRSVHADFAISNAVPRASTLNGGRLTLGPGAAAPVAETPEREYDGIPKLVAGSAIPYAITGLDPNQTYNIRLNDSQTFLVQNAVAAADGSASGFITVPSTVAENAGVNWLRLLTGTGGGTVRSIVAPYARAADAAPRTADVAASAQRGRSLAVTGTGLLKEAFYITGNPADGQTVTARLDGTGTPFHVRADANGVLTGALPIPAGTALGTHTVDLYVGFRAGSDFPQAVYRRTFEVTEFVPDPTPVTPTPETPIVVPPVVEYVQPPKQPVAPAPTPERAARVASTSLKAAKRRIAVKLGRGSVARKVAVTVRTTAKVRVGKRAKVVTLATGTSTLKAGTAGQSTTLKLKLTAEGRALLKRVTRVRVVVRVAPTAQGAKAVTRTVWLRG